MLFNSYEFLFLFLPTVFILYYYFNSKYLFVTSKIFLVISSLFFYGYWNIMYLPIIILSIVVNFYIGLYLNLEKNQKKNKIFLIIGIIFNLLLLGYFKYSDFFISNFNFLFGKNISLLQIVLPLAISFFTFQQIAYLVDIYKGKFKESNFFDYVLFVSFFPQLIAGPIVHHLNIMPQFSNLKNKTINYKNIALGIFMISIGLFKKIILADTFAIWVNSSFDNDVLNTYESWMTSFSFTFQLYFDFSAYSDIAIGLGLLFNIKLPINFNSPYKQTSIISFWKNWHITLSKFINAYLFNPILKSFQRYTFMNAMFSIFITMALVGMWHGSGWTFIVFGILHGLALIINHLWKKTKLKIHSFIGWFLTFNFVNLSLVLFRADSIEIAINMYSEMFTFSFLNNGMFFVEQYNNFSIKDWENGFTDFAYSSIWILIGFVLVLCFKNSNEQLKDLNFSYKLAIFTSLLLVMSILALSLEQEFYYFRF